MSAVDPSLDPSRIEARLREAFGPAAVIEVHDDGAAHAGHAGARAGGHYTVMLVSARFANLSRVARHRLVYDALLPWFQQGIHALAIVARAPEETAGQTGREPGTTFQPVLKS